jgi:hypothetical protein
MCSGMVFPSLVVVTRVSSSRHHESYSPPTPMWTQATKTSPLGGFRQSDREGGAAVRAGVAAAMLFRWSTATATELRPGRAATVS